MLSLALLKIPAEDLGSSVAFYEAALGLTTEFRSEDYGWAQMGGAAVPLAIYVPGKGGGAGTTGAALDFHLSHPDPASLLAAVEAASPDAAPQLHRNDDGSTSLEFRDPAGNAVKIMKGG
ncbi:MAG: hypothetical protein Kilf2KO_39030 [Rhodospirillales bacterium]